MNLRFLFFLFFIKFTEKMRFLREKYTFFQFLMLFYSNFCVFVNKAKVLIFNLDFAHFAQFQISTIKQFDVLWRRVSFLQILNIIKIKPEKIEKRIDVIERIVDVNNSNHDKNKDIDAICTDAGKVKRYCKEDKEWEISKKMLVSYVFGRNNLHTNLLVRRKVDIPHKSKNPKSNKKQKCNQIQSVKNVEGEILIYYLNNKFYKDQKIHRNKCT